MNKKIKRVFLFLTMFLVIVGMVMLFLPSIALAAEVEEPTCDGSTWNSNSSGNTVTVSGGNIITAIRIKAGDNIGPAAPGITADGNYGHFVQVEAAGDPTGSGCSSLVYGEMFVLQSAPPAGYEWFGHYDVDGIGTNSVTVTVYHHVGQAVCVIQNVSHLEYICEPGTTTTTDPGTTTTTRQDTTTTTQPVTTTTTQPVTTTTTQPVTTTTTGGTTSTTGGTTSTTGGTTSTTGGTTTTGPTTTTQPTGGIQVLALTGFNSLWYIAGSVLIALGVIMGSFSLSTALRKR